MDYGWTFLPFGQTFECNTVAASIINDLASEVYEHGKEMLWDLVKGYFVALFIQHFAAWLLGKTLAGFMGAIAMYTIYCSVETLVLYFSSGNDPYAWLTAFMASAIGGTYGLFKAGLDKLIDWLTAAGRRLMQEIGYFMNPCWARGLDFLDITGIAFSLIDFAFAALYLYQFVTLIG